MCKTKNCKLKVGHRTEKWLSNWRLNLVHVLRFIYVLEIYDKVEKFSYDAFPLWDIVELGLVLRWCNPHLRTKISFATYGFLSPHFIKWDVVFFFLPTAKRICGTYQEMKRKLFACFKVKGSCQLCSTPKMTIQWSSTLDPGSIERIIRRIASSKLYSALGNDCQTHALTWSILLLTTYCIFYQIWHHQPFWLVINFIITFGTYF